MADLPKEHVIPSPLFTHCGADMFGPFIVKNGRKEFKRYGCIFTCMSSCAAHRLQMIWVRTPSFKHCVVLLPGEGKSDNGTNFIGAENELKKAIERR